MYGWQNEIIRLGLFALAAMLIGSLFGSALLFLLLFLLGYIAHSLIQLRRLRQWLIPLENTSESPTPESFGLWGEVFDVIHRLQKKERESSLFLESIINKAQESSAALEIAVVMIDSEGNLNWWNKASEKLLGIEYPRDRYQSVTNLIRDPRFIEYFQNQEYDETLRIDEPSNKGHVLDFQIGMFGDNERLMIVRDVTQLHRLELMRKDFIGNVSHELGTPITVIKGYLETILDNSSPDERWRKPLEQMQQQSVRMENIVNDLLMLSSLETESFKRKSESIDITDLINCVVKDVQQMYAERNHEYVETLVSNVTISGDRAELYSAISNLLVNAAKYTPAGGRIEAISEIREGILRITIADNGPGIAAHHLPRLTERFYRTDVGRSTETGGTGLGLAIVKHILARLHAELEISSIQGEGSRFSCVIPLNRVQHNSSNNIPSDKSVELDKVS